MARHDLLFAAMDAFGVQEHQKREVASAIASIDPNRLLNTNVDDLVGYVVEKYRIDVPVLDEAGMHLNHAESQRDVYGDPMRIAFHMGHREPLHVTGTEFIVEVPFSGDAELFRVRPSTYDSGPPHGDVVGNTLVFRYWTDNTQSERVRAEIDSWLGSVRRYLQ